MNTDACELSSISQSDESDIWALKAKTRKIPSCVLQGEQAYRWLLETAVGLRSTVQGHDKTLCEIKTNFKQLKENNHSLHETLQPVIKQVFNDSGKILQYLQKKCLPTGQGKAIYARQALQLTRGSNKNVLVIGGSEKLSLEVFQVFFDFAKEIYITHEDDIMNQSIKSEIDSIKKTRTRGHTDISRITIYESMERFEKIHNIVIARPICNDDYDELLIEVAKEANANIIHLVGDPKQRGTLTGFWAALKNQQNFWGPDELRAIRDDNFQQNEILFSNTAAIIATIASCRANEETFDFKSLEALYEAQLTNRLLINKQKRE
jgi:hypothetical protein